MSTYSAKKKFTIAVLAFCITSLAALTFPPHTSAADACSSAYNVQIRPNSIPKNFPDPVTVTIRDTTNVDRLELVPIVWSVPRNIQTDGYQFVSNGDGTWSVNIPPEHFDTFGISAFNLELDLIRKDAAGNTTERCELGSLEVTRDDAVHGSTSCTIIVGQEDSTGTLNFNRACYDNTSAIWIGSSDILVEGEPYDGEAYLGLDRNENRKAVNNGIIQADSYNLEPGAYDVYIHIAGYSFVCEDTFEVKGGTCSEEDSQANSGSEDTEITEFKLCDNIPTPEFQEEYDSCIDCINDESGVWTALGCIQFSAAGFATSILRLAIGIGGGIALIIILFGAFQINTSSGNPEKTQSGKELIGAALSGLAFIIFSVVLLDIIGIQLFQIPGF